MEMQWQEWQTIQLILMGEMCNGECSEPSLVQRHAWQTIHNVTFLGLQNSFFTCLLILSHHVTSPSFPLSHDRIT